MIPAAMTTLPSAEPSTNVMARLGSLRVMLLLCVAVIIAAAPLADGNVHTSDWRLFPSVIAPSVMMMLVFALPLDMTMARIFMSDTTEIERLRLRFVITVEAWAYGALLAAWTPFLLGVLELSPFD
jgi:hypothetical protein